MSFAQSTCEPLYSGLANDADMRELVELFVQELPGRIGALRLAADNLDLREVSRLAHQLKGAGGSHGFPHITVAAAAVERAAASGQVDPLVDAVNLLGGICDRARSGPSL